MRVAGLYPVVCLGDRIDPIDLFLVSSGLKARV